MTELTWYRMLTWYMMYCFESVHLLKSTKSKGDQDDEQELWSLSKRFGFAHVC